VLKPSQDHNPAEQCILARHRRGAWPAGAWGIRQTHVGSVLAIAAGALQQAAMIDGDPDRRAQWTDELLATPNGPRGRAHQVHAGERVAVRAQNSPEWVILEFGGRARGLNHGHGTTPLHRGDELAPCAR